MNFLILSCGTRNKVVQFFREAINPTGGIVVATDCSPVAPALYDADKHYICKRMTEVGYIDEILDICRREKIAGVISLIDPELSLLALNAERFAEVGTKVVGSPYEQCERTLNKWEMSRWLLENGFRTQKTYPSRDAFYAARERGEVDFPVFVKPAGGSASIAVQKIKDDEMLCAVCAEYPDMIIQELMTGQEYGADCYIDLISGKCVAIFVKKKLVMRAGETDKAVSFNDPALLEMLRDFAEKSGFCGQIDIDIFAGKDGYYISEVNPRFGGGYPHAYLCGVKTPQLIANNLAGKENEPCIGNYESGIVMMKYNEIKLLREDGYTPLN